MAKFMRPRDSHDATLYLRMLYEKTEADLIKEILRKRTKGYMDYAEVAALERVQGILQDMVDESWSYVPGMIEKIFYKNSEKHAAGYANAMGLTSTQTVIIRQLADNLLGEIMEAADNVQRSVEDIFSIGRMENSFLRETALKSVAEQQASGAGIRSARARMVQELNNNGITAFTDAAGRKWRLTDYCNMATRTTARQAEVSTILTLDPDYDLYTIVRIGSTCPVCAPLEGRVYSRSGTSSDYPPLALAFGKKNPAGENSLENTYLNIHPNCLHSLVKYTTIGKTDEQIQKDKDFSDPSKNPMDRDPRTKRQIEEYRKKVAARQKLLNDRKQYQNYRSVLDDDVPKSFDKFMNMKYNDPERWKEMQALYRKTNAYNKIILREPELTSDLLRISQRTGVEMVGLDYRTKSRESFLRKINKKSKNSQDVNEIDRAVSGTKDVIRYTYQDDAPNLTESYRKIRQELSEKGYELVDIKNTWLNKNDPYNGINCTFRTPGGPDGKKGQNFEVQFHTKASYQLKDQMHKDYEEWRVLSPASPEAIAIRKRMMEQSKGIEVPQNIEEVVK